MFIEDRRMPEYITSVEKVESGDCFMHLHNYIGNVFMRIDTESMYCLRNELNYTEYKNGVPCVSLKTGAFMTFDKETKVIPVDAKVVLVTL